MTAPERLGFCGACNAVHMRHCSDPEHCGHSAEYIRADLATPDPLLAEALEALRFYADENRSGLPSDGPWGLGSNDFGRRARAVLAKMEGR